MTSDQLESLLRELAIARKSTEQLTQQIETIHRSPAWRWIAAYRSRLQNGSVPVRMMDRAMRLVAGCFSQDGFQELPVDSPMDGKLVHCLDPMYLGRYFYCRGGKRHWVRSKAHLARFASDLNVRDVIRASSEDMASYQLAGPLPLAWSEEDWKKPDRKSTVALREITVSRLRGVGIEFGAGVDPLAVPLHCDVQYADSFTEGDLRSLVFYAPGTDHVPLSYRMTLEDMHPVADGSLDFVIATHLIQQVRNPLLAFEQAYRKLQRGGRYVLIVPDMRRMFDRDRELTALDHLVSDYENPNAERDAAHYREFFQKVRHAPDELLGEQVKQAIATSDHIHFHTWTYESFQAMVKYICRKIVPWRSVWSQPCLDDPGAYEFYFVLEK